MDFVKKEWQFRDIISENELNRMEDGIEEGITKAEQAQQIANEAKATADDVQSELSAHASATTGVHGATSAATPNTLVQRDSAGRFKAAAPSASDDVARKAEVDAVDSAAMKKVADSDLDMNNKDIINVNRFRIRNSLTLTIDSNKSITISRMHHRITTSGGADELHTINGGNENDLLLLRIATGANPVTIKHGVGNIGTPDGADIPLTNVRQWVLMVKTSADWHVIASGVGLNRAGDTMTGTLTIQGGQFIQKHSRPQHALISTATNEGVRTEYREDQKRLRWQSTDGNGAFVGQLMYLDRETGELYLTPSEHKVWHAGNDGAGSGLDADLLDGMQPSTSASANTIVQRDSSGRIKAAAPSASDDVVRKAELDEHANRTDNPHGVTKSQVGLGNVQNYGIASQAQAQAGTANNVYMTPLRTKQAIDQFVPIETGIWTPELRFGESTSGITYQFRIARYTRIANVVYWTFEIELSSKGSASGTATIAGLPFADLSGFDFYHTVGRAINISIPSGQWLSSHIVGTTIYLATNTGSSLTNTEFANNSRIYASGFYFIS